MSSKTEEEEEFAICVDCGNSIEKCMCVCPYCGERDKCECALFDAATGGSLINYLPRGSYLKKACEYL